MVPFYFFHKPHSSLSGHMELIQKILPIYSQQFSLENGTPLKKNKKKKHNTLFFLTFCIQELLKYHFLMPGYPVWFVFFVMHAPFLLIPALLRSSTSYTDASLCCLCCGRSLSGTLSSPDLRPWHLPVGNLGC